MDRFRVAARKYIHFQNRMAKKGPNYFNCNEKQSSCTRRKAQPRIGCPDCEFTIQYKFLVSELTEELNKLRRTTRKGARRWPVKSLIEKVQEIQGYANSTKFKNPKWSVLVSMLVSVYRDEHSKIKGAENFQTFQQMEAEKAQRANRDRYE